MLRTSVKVLIGVTIAFLIAKRGSMSSSLGAGRFLNQSDPRWSSKLVGNGAETYGRVGCVVTAMTIACNMLKGTTLTPDHLKPGIMLTSSDFTGGSVNSDQAFTRLGCVVRGRIRSVTRTPSTIAQMRNLIDGCLAQGGVALVRVDYDLSTADDNHTIVCFSRDSLGYHCADPAGGVEIILDENLFARRNTSKTYSANGVQPVFRA